MESYLLTKAQKYAKKNIRNFDKITKEFGINIHDRESFEHCKQIYKDYKQIFCVFDNIINFGYLFENESELFNRLKYSIEFVTDEIKYRDIFKYELGGIYKKIFGQIPRKHSLMEKVEDSNEQVFKLKSCIENRIKYHYWCENHHIKYNKYNHEIEILISVYLYKRIKDIQLLLNNYRDKYLVIREEIRQENEMIRQENERINKELDKRTELFEDLSDESSKSVSEAFEIVLKKEKRRK